MRLLPLLLLLQFFLQFSGLGALDVNTTNYVVHQNSNNGSSPSLWIKSVMNQDWRRRRGCRYRPWICNPPGERGRRRRKKCCRNRCIDVYSDVNHCGLCRRRCPFSWSCCARRCVDTRFSRRNCGKCFNRCHSRVSCVMGMCGYAYGFSPSIDFPHSRHGQVFAQPDGSPEHDILIDDEQVAN